MKCNFEKRRSVESSQPNSNLSLHITSVDDLLKQAHRCHVERNFDAVCPDTLEEVSEKLMLLVGLYSYDISYHDLERFDYTLESICYLPKLLDILINDEQDAFENLVKKLGSYMTMTIWKSMSCEVLVHEEIDKIPEYARFWFLKTIDICLGHSKKRFNPYLIAGESLKGDGKHMRFDPQPWIDMFQKYFKIDIQRYFVPAEE